MKQSYFLAQFEKSTHFESGQKRTYKYVRQGNVECPQLFLDKSGLNNYAVHSGWVGQSEMKHESKKIEIFVFDYIIDRV